MSEAISIWAVIYFLVPAALANMAPVFVKKFNFLNYPVDFKLKINGKRIFGDNKTFRGLFLGIISAIIFVFVQKYLYNFEFFESLSIVDYASVNSLLLGFFVGSGVLIGDLVGSFIKRRFSFRPGESFLILDQVNGGIGIAFVSYFYFKSWILILWIILIWLIGHFIIKYLGYLLNIYKEKI